MIAARSAAFDYKGGSMVDRNRKALHALVRLGGIIGSIVCGSYLTFAQGVATATMSGVVRDGTGGVVPGATVTMKQTETGLTRMVATTEDGSYRMPALPVGPYEVTAEKLGFKQQ